MEVNKLFMDRFPKKECKYCGGRGHFPYACYKNPKRQEAATKPLKPRTPIKQKTKLRAHGKVSKQWVLTRATWIRKNPPPIDATYWECYLRISSQCPVRLDLPLLTLDHVISRSRDPSKRFDLSNLQPCCWWCNTEKGSKSLDQVKSSGVV